MSLQQASLRAIIDLKTLDGARVDEAKLPSVITHHDILRRLRKLFVELVRYFDTST